MKTVFEPEFIEDLQYWVKENRKVALKILSLVDHVAKDPHKGIGKPERLKFLGSDVWSRRITQEHRMVYKIAGKNIYFLQARYHY